MSDFLTIPEAAEVARVSPKRLRNLMATGVLREGTHYTKPAHLGPRFKRAALLAWLDPPDPNDVPMRGRVARRRRLSVEQV